MILNLASKSDSLIATWVIKIFFSFKPRYTHSLDFILLKTDRKFNNYAILTEIQKKSENDVGLFVYNAKVMVYTYLSCKL